MNALVKNAAAVLQRTDLLGLLWLEHWLRSCWLAR